MPTSFEQGPAYSGIVTFAGLPLVQDAAELEGADAAIVGAPIDEMVTNRPGTRFGPRAIRLAYYDSGSDALHMDLGVEPFRTLQVVDHGDAAVVPGNARASHDAIRQTVERVARSGAVPIVLGGDHSISFPNISAVSAVHGSDDLAVVHFDTHADTGKANWGVRWAHGTPFFNLVDTGALRGDRLIQVGLRGYWPHSEEWAWMRSVGIRWHRMEEIVDRGIGAVMGDVLEEIGSATKIFLSVDIDVLDPGFAPGTGTPEPGGMSSRELLRAVRTIVSARGMVGMDLVEVSPPYDHADITALAAHRVVIEALSALALHRRGAPAEPEDPA